MNAIFTRTSVRHFKNEALLHEQIERLLRAAFSAPSAKNLQPWFFMVVTDRQKILELKDFSPYAMPLETATLAIVVCANTQANPSLDYCQQDCAAATQNILVEAKDMGLGSCWLGGYPNQDRIEKLKEILPIPDEIQPLWVLALGIPDEEPSIKEKYDEQKIIWLGDKTS